MWRRYGATWIRLLITRSSYSRALDFTVNGDELAEQLLASKPNDIHSLNAKKLGIPRDQAKSVSYALMYGAAYQKLKKMLGLTDEQAKALFDAYWDAVEPLKNLRDAVGISWEARGKSLVIVTGKQIGRAHV